MIAPESYKKCSEIYIIEETVEVVVEIAGEMQTIRIEALRDLRSGRVCTRAFRQENVTLQPTYPKTGGKYDRKPEEFEIWVDYDLPWTDREEADQALTQALGFLGERCDK
jgi:hypothetical protein